MWALKVLKFEKGEKRANSEKKKEKKCTGETLSASRANANAKETI